MSSPRPFADSVTAYAQAGWPCVMPVPLEKAPPPVGFTGAEGIDTDPVQLAMWMSSHADSSVALRMPDGVIGIDVDEYVKGETVKRGAATLAGLIEQFGDLPSTWSSTARGQHSPSRIHFFRVPALRYVTKFSDVEIIQRHHRYAVVWPSPHKDVSGVYTWYGPSGAPSDTPPKIEELAELPQRWIDGLREGATDQAAASADVGSGYTLLSQITADERDECAEITNVYLKAVAEAQSSSIGARHDFMTERTHELIQLAAVGHTGSGPVIERMRDLWTQLTAGEDRTEEFERMLLTSARKAVSRVGLNQIPTDPCMMLGSIAIAAPAPVDNRPANPDEPNEPMPAPIESPRQIHPFQIIGTGVFDPHEGLDQRLSERVLERMWPVLRYASDSHAWLLRGPDRWETHADLSDWAVALLADLMPTGNPDAEKGSEAYDQAARRKRFMSAATSASIARKIRSIVAGGVHPASLRITDLDSEPWLLWAGGVGWDLRASLEMPTNALIDPSTPHLHSAGVRPENRPTPLWDAFLEAVWPDPELRAWAVRVLSIAITGYADKALPILIGEQGRGKTQVVALVMSVLGSYAHAADPRLLGGADKAHASIVYALMGRRLSFIDEGPRDGKTGRESLKQITGGAELTGNQMGKNPVTFRPSHTLILTSNDEPALVDPAIRARVRLIPCEGDPEAVRRARAAIGFTGDVAWRREAPGVLAQLMREAAAWLADQDSALTVSAPEKYRYLAETIAAEQNPIPGWLEEETLPDPVGDRARTLYEAFSDWCLRGNIDRRLIPNPTKWGKELTKLGFPSGHTRTGKTRPLKLRSRGGWEGYPAFSPIPEISTDVSVTSSDQLVTSSEPNRSQQESQQYTVVLEPQSTPVTSVTSSEYRDTTHTHTRIRTEVENGSEPVTPITAQPESESAKITRRLLSDRRSDTFANPTAQTEAILETVAALNTEDGLVAPIGAFVDIDSSSPAKPKRAGKLTDEEKAARVAERATTKAAERAQERLNRIAVAGGPQVALPAVVLRDGTVTPIAADKAREVLELLGGASELTVDVEHTGYPVGHADYALRTIQVGNEMAAVVFDAQDGAQGREAASLLRDATTLHAHSATADLVPLTVAGVIADEDELELMWRKMADTALPAKLADPQSTGNGEGLKELSDAVLGEHAVSPAAEAGRAELFKAGGWLKDVDSTTPTARSGWAQVDSRSTTMVRYAAADVLDDAALAKRLPVVPPHILDRERLAQRSTARVTYRGLRLDGEHVTAKRAEYQAGRAAATIAVRAFGIDNPGSPQQVAQRLVELGARLPVTPKGKPSVAKGAIEGYRNDAGPVGDCVRAVLDYRHRNTALILLLDPYFELVTRGDGRARPTVYTLGADTGRMSCVRPNLQQVSRQGGIRPCITADPGFVIVSADFASVEIRVAAALSGDENLQRMLAEGADVHGLIAKEVYGPEATKEDRYNTKRGVFGRLYGSGIPGIARTLAISEAKAQSTVDVLDSFTPRLAQFTNELKVAVQRGMREFETYSGRIVHLDQKQPHKALNYLVQGTARELLIDTLVKLDTTRWGRATLLPVHDEVLMFVPESEAAEATAALVAAMETSLHGVQIKAEASEPSFYWRDAS